MLMDGKLLMHEASKEEVLLPPELIYSKLSSIRFFTMSYKTKVKCFEKIMKVVGVFCPPKMNRNRFFLKYSM